MTNPPPPPPPQTAAPGWYPTAPGTQGYWDGQKWTGDVAPLGPTMTVRATDNTMPMLAHLLGIFTSFIGPLIIFLIIKDESPYGRQQAAEALNFQITVIISYIVSFVLLLVIIGFLTMLATMILGLIFPIMASVAAYRGEPYRYPINIRMVS